MRATLLTVAWIGLARATRVAELWVSGQNRYCSSNQICIGGQLGLGDTLNRAEFEPVRCAPACPPRPLTCADTAASRSLAAGANGLDSEPTLDRVAQASGGALHTLVLLADGTVLGMGDNRFGQLGLGHTDGRLTPQLLPAFVGGRIERISAGAGYSLFVRGATEARDELWAVGENSNGQLGLGDLVDRHSPVMLSGSSEFNAQRWVSISAGRRHAMAVDWAGRLWGWGSNSFGALGMGNTLRALLPELVPAGFASFRSVVAGREHTIVLHEDGAASGCGQNDLGQLGMHGGSRRHLASVEIAGHVRQVALGDVHTVFLLITGAVYVSGANRHGQLGLRSESTGSVSTPLAVIQLHNIVRIAAGGDFTMAIGEDGSLWAFGDNRLGQLGERGGDDNHAVQQVAQIGYAAADVAVGTHFSMVIKGSCAADGDWGHVSCPCSPCEPGRYASVDVLAEECRDGSVINVDRCLACQIGRSSIVDAAPEASTCIACPPGKYGTDEGLDQCTDCESGRYAEAYQNTVGCDDCPSGRYTVGGATQSDECVSCAVGSIATSSAGGGAECTSCERGRYGADAVILSADMQCAEVEERAFTGTITHESWESCTDDIGWRSVAGESCPDMRGRSVMCGDIYGRTCPNLAAGCRGQTSFPVEQLITQTADEACPVACELCTAVTEANRRPTGVGALYCDTFRLSLGSPAQSFCSDAQWFCQPAGSANCFCATNARSVIEVKMRSLTRTLNVRVDLLDAFDSQTSLTPLYVTLPIHEWVTATLDFNGHFRSTPDRNGLPKTVDARYITDLIFYVLDGANYALGPVDISVAEVRHRVRCSGLVQACRESQTSSYITSASSWSGPACESSSCLGSETGCVPCSPGTALDAVGVIGGDLCAECNPGLFADSGSATCEPCPAGTYLDGLRCSHCPAGQYSGAVGATDGSTCTPCVAGRYSPLPGTMACTNCSLGRFSDMVGSATAADCLDCPEGKFRTSFDDGGYTSCLDCPPGQFSAPGSLACEYCPLGRGLPEFAFFYHARRGDSDVTMLSASGHWEQCQNCSEGMHSMISVHHDYEGGSSYGYRDCSQCPEGRWQSANGSHYCVACDAGRSSKAVGATSSGTCASCALGQISDSGSDTCRKCEHGKEFDERTQDCVGCENGADSGYDSQCRACDRPEVCLGNGTCSPGYTGRWCADCEPAHFRYHKHCYACPEDELWNYLIGIGCFLGFALIFLKLGKVSSNQAMGGVVAPAALGMARLQVAIKIFEINFDLPDFVIRLLRWLSHLITLDFAGLATPECIWPIEDVEQLYLTRIVEVALLLPLLCILILFLSLIWVTIVTFDRDRPSPINSMMTAFSMLFVVLVSCGLHTINCTTDFGDLRLADRTDIRCQMPWEETKWDAQEEQLYRFIGEGHCLSTRHSTVAGDGGFLGSSTSNSDLDLDRVDLGTGDEWAEGVHSGLDRGTGRRQMQTNVDILDSGAVTYNQFSEINGRVRDGVESEHECKISCDSFGKKCSGYAYTYRRMVNPARREVAGRCILYGPVLDAGLNMWDPIGSNTDQWFAYHQRAFGWANVPDRSSRQACEVQVSEGCCTVSVSFTNPMRVSEQCDNSCCRKMYQSSRVRNQYEQDRQHMDASFSEFSAGLDSSFSDSRQCVVDAGSCWREQTCDWIGKQDAECETPNTVCMVKEERESIYWSIAGLGLAIIVICGVALPISLFKLLRRSDLVDPYVRHRYGWMYHRFERRAWWFEFVVMMEKTSIVVIAVFFGRASHGWLAWGLMLFAILVMLGLQLKIKPWVEREDDPTIKVCCGFCLRVRLTLNRLEEVGLVCQLGTLVPCAYFIQHDDTESNTALAVGAFILLSQGVFILAVVTVQFYKLRHSNKAGMVGKYSRRLKNAALRTGDAVDEDEDDAPAEWNGHVVNNPVVLHAAVERTRRQPPQHVSDGWDEKTLTLYQNLLAVVEDKLTKIEVASLDSKPTDALEDELARAIKILDQLEEGSLRRRDRGPAAPVERDIYADLEDEIEASGDDAAAEPPAGGNRPVQDAAEGQTGSNLYGDLEDEIEGRSSAAAGHDDVSDSEDGSGSEEEGDEDEDEEDEGGSAAVAGDNIYGDLEDEIEGRAPAAAEASSPPPGATAVRPPQFEAAIERRALPAGGPRIESRSKGYVVELDPDWLDDDEECI